MDVYFELAKSVNPILNYLHSETVVWMWVMEDKVG